MSLCRIADRCWQLRIFINLKLVERTQICRCGMGLIRYYMIVCSRRLLGPFYKFFNVIDDVGIVPLRLYCNTMEFVSYSKAFNPIEGVDNMSKPTTVGTFEVGFV